MTKEKYFNRYHNEIYCDICGKELDEVRKHHLYQMARDYTAGRTPTCSICGKTLCLDHTVIYIEKTYKWGMSFGGGGDSCWHEDVVFRCPNHKLDIKR